MRRSVRAALHLGVATALLGVGVGYGFIASAKRWYPYPLLRDASAWWQAYARDWTSRPPGKWQRQPDPTPALSESQEAEIEQLAALGYVSGTQEALSGDVGVVLHDPEAAFQGLNLYCSGHGPEAILMDMDGREVHRWRLPYDEAFPEGGGGQTDFRRDFWRKVHLYPNGDLLAIFEGLGILKVDAASKLLWANHNSSHHDMWEGENGEVYVLTRTPRLIPEVNPDHPVLEDFITLLGPDGVERKRNSVLEAVLRSDFLSLMDYSHGRGDLFHTNAIEILDGRHAERSPGFAKGNALVSMPELNAIATIDLTTNRVVWALAGLSTFQHDPILLENGNVLLFDNRGARTPEGKPASRVIEVNPATQGIVWSYHGSPAQPLWSDCCGTSQRLPNGNTLITESEPGRAIEVTPDHRVVWLFHTPHRAGDDGELVATLMQMMRLGPDFPLDWLPR